MFLSSSSVKKTRFTMTGSIKASWKPAGDQIEKAWVNTNGMRSRFFRIPAFAEMTNNMIFPPIFFLEPIKIGVY
jgi:hypothetical protein